MRRDCIICVALIALTLAVFWPVGQFDFINYDDPQYVVKNKEVQSGITLESVRWAFTTGKEGSWHPLTWLSHMLTWQLFGPNPGAHHWVNLVFHIATAVLLFLALNRMTGTVWRSAFVAFLFALHPLRVESVAWVSERKDVLSGFFAVLTLWAYATYVKSKIRSPESKAWYAGALVFFALGLMSKPMLVTLPVILLLLDFWPLDRLTIHDSRPKVSKLVCEKIPFFVLAAGAGYLSFHFHRQAGYLETLEALPVESRIPNALFAYLAYVGKMLWPRHLSVFYPYHAVPAWQAIGAALLLLVVCGWSIRNAQRRPYLFIGWLWYLMMLLPVIGIVQFGWHSMADRFTYLPLIGLFVAVAWGIAEALPATRPYRIGIVISALVAIIGCVAVTRNQLQYWRNSVVLFSHALEVTTRNAVAHNNLGCALEESGNKQEAFEHYRTAIEIMPAYANAHNNLGSILIAQGEYRQAEAHLRTALEVRPAYEIARFNLGTALALQGKNYEAETCFAEALQHDPGNAALHRSLANVFSARGKISNAFSEYGIALKLDPEDTATREGLALLFARQRRFNEALAQLDEALKRRPTVEAHTLAAAICAEQGDLQGTVQHYRQALLLEPNSLSTMNNLAWMLATSPDASIRNGTEAIRLAQKACELSKFKRPITVGTLAAAYAETGRFDEAIKTAETACALATELKMPAVLKKNQELLELYRAGHPYRESQGTNRIDQTDNNAQSP